jgi:hypothetical protein
MKRYPIWARPLGLLLGIILCVATAYELEGGAGEAALADAERDCIDVIAGSAKAVDLEELRINLFRGRHSDVLAVSATYEVVDAAASPTLVVGGRALSNLAAVATWEEKGASQGEMSDGSTEAVTLPLESFDPEDSFLDQDVRGVRLDFTEAVPSRSVRVIAVMYRPSSGLDRASAQIPFDVSLGCGKRCGDPGRLVVEQCLVTDHPFESVPSRAILEVSIPEDVTILRVVPDASQYENRSLVWILGDERRQLRGAVSVEARSQIIVTAVVRSAMLLIVGAAVGAMFSWSSARHANDAGAQ